jgi:5-oxoprolinase (ATP-hydrolysing) subunit C
MGSVLRIITAGPGVTLQDGGRHGYLRYGVTPAGPMDRLAFNTANHALGMAPGTTAIEIGLAGLEFTVEEAPLAVAIAGGAFVVALDGRRLPPAVLLRVDVGSVVKITPGVSGAWCYLAIGGQLEVTPMLGSVATHVRSGFGGLDGRAVIAGDRLPVTALAMPGAFGSLDVPWLNRPADIIRVVLGPQDDYFAADQIDAFLAGPWALSTRGDRMAYFLEGPRLAHADGFNIVSDGVAMGAIQVPGEGQPIVLMADRQPTGGYPKIATVAGVDLGRLAQARPGQAIRFQAVTVAEAVAVLREEARLLEAPIAVAPLVRTEFSTGFLLSQSLVDTGLADTANGVTPEGRHAAGQLTASERLEVLFDHARFVTEEGCGASALILAQGVVEGRRVFAVSRDAMVRGGALTAGEIHRLAAFVMRAAAEVAPTVLIFDGAAIAEGDDAASWAAVAALHAACHAAVAPRVALVLGPCLGPDALLAALADVIVVTADHGFAAGAGPALVQSVTGEVLTGQDLGGPAALLASGLLVDRVPHDVAALQRARRLLDALPDAASPLAQDPREAPSLDRLVPRDCTAGYDMQTLLAAIADDGEVVEIATDHAGNVVIALARFGGRAVGVLATQPLVLGGALDAAGLAKAARFAERCAALALPLLILADCPGLLPGAAQEKAGLLRHAADLARAVAALHAPRLVVVTRNLAGPVAALLDLSRAEVFRWPSAAAVGFGAVIAPRETRRRILGALAGDGQ